jgi:hypothetical protein
MKDLFGKMWIAVIPVLLAALGYTGYDLNQKRLAAAEVNIVVEAATVTTVVEKNYMTQGKTFAMVEKAFDLHRAEYH